MIERLRHSVPGVQSVGAVSRLPLAGGNSSRTFNIPGSSQSYSADIRVSTPDYFQTMGIPLLKGRNFIAHDSSASLPVAIINEAAAANVFRSGSNRQIPNELRTQGVEAANRRRSWKCAARGARDGADVRRVYTPLAQAAVALDVHRGAVRGFESADS